VNNDDVKTTIVKLAAMLAVILAQWWMMQPYHEPLIPRLYQVLAAYCYRLAGLFGTWGLTFEYNYYQAV
jgi:hypothetical protein